MTQRNDVTPPQLNIAVRVDEPDWQTTFDDLQATLEKTLTTAFELSWHGVFAGPVQMAEVSLLLTDNETVKTLNRDYRNQDKPTNVLAFAVLDGEDTGPRPEGAPVMLGDIIMAYGVLMTEAGDKKIQPSSHLCHLVVHGMLHLLGFDHQSDDEAGEMEAMESRILKKLGVADPYE